MFKYPQHLAWETRGEMEPTDLKLFTGEVKICHDGHISEWICRAAAWVVFITAPPGDSSYEGFFLKSSYYFTLVTLCGCESNHTQYHLNLPAMPAHTHHSCWSQNQLSSVFRRDCTDHWHFVVLTPPSTVCILSCAFKKKVLHTRTLFLLWNLF